MIIDVPTAEDLNGSALALLNMAWETALGSFRMLEGSELDTWDIDGGARDDYHASSQPSLRHAIVMVHQAQELGLKARIASISPYLLLAGDPRLWPAKCDRQATSFEEFRTIDASDLIRVCNTVCAEPLEPNFARLFEQGRRARNKILHLGGHRMVSDAREILIQILDTASALFAEQRWASHRMMHEFSAGYAVIGGQDAVEMGLLSDFALLQTILEPRYIRQHFGFDKRRASYACASCSHEERRWDTPSRFAQLAEDDGAELFCAVCTETYPVLREACGVALCRSDVLDADDRHWGRCLRCGEVSEARMSAAKEKFRALLTSRASEAGMPDSA